MSALPSRRCGMAVAELAFRRRRRVVQGCSCQGFSAIFAAAIGRCSRCDKRVRRTAGPGDADSGLASAARYLDAGLEALRAVYSRLASRNSHISPGRQMRASCSSHLADAAGRAASPRASINPSIKGATGGGARATIGVGQKSNHVTLVNRHSYGCVISRGLLRPH